MKKTNSREYSQRPGKIRSALYTADWLWPRAPTKMTATLRDLPRPLHQRKAKPIQRNLTIVCILLVLKYLKTSHEGCSPGSCLVGKKMQPATWPSTERTLQASHGRFADLQGLGWQCVSSNDCIRGQDALGGIKLIIALFLLPNTIAFISCATGHILEQ